MTLSEMTPEQKRVALQEVCDTLFWLQANFEKKFIRNTLVPGERAHFSPEREAKKRRASAAFQMRKSGMKFKDIAARLGVTTQTARSVASDGRRAKMWADYKTWKEEDQPI